jgi:hypothetical protein
MSDSPTQEHRRARLLALIQSEPYGGNLSELGRALGYKDGVFVRQMRDGDRPISEKTVARIEALPGRAGWFGAVNLSKQALQVAEAYEKMSAAERARLDRLMAAAMDVPIRDAAQTPQYAGGLSGLGELDETKHHQERKKKGA